MKALTGPRPTTYRHRRHERGCVLAHSGTGWFFHSRCALHPPHIRRTR